MDPVSAILDWSVAQRALPGELCSGDLAVVRAFPQGVLVAVVDGLGHGRDAAEAARASVAVLERHAAESVISLLRRCHTALGGTRGAVMTVASFNGRDDTMTWIGVGNVAGVLVHAGERNGTGRARAREAVLQRGGVVGVDLPPLRAVVVPVTRGDTVVFATDGLRPEFAAEQRLDERPPRAANDLLERYAKDNDDALVLVARYLGGST